MLTRVLLVIVVKKERKGWGRRTGEEGIYEAGVKGVANIWRKWVEGCEQKGH